MKKNVYLVQVNVAYSDYLAYLPYAAGCIAAYVFADETINEIYALGDILYLRKPVTEAIEEIRDPAVVGFSCYIWNMEYNKTLARMIKERYPDCLIVFGGHNIPFNTELLETEPYIDVLMHGEGEFCFKEFLLAADRGDISSVNDISYRERDRFVTTPKRDKCFPLDELPSPYTTGVFDQMLAEYPKIAFQGILETSRGCPYSCAFCDWCFSKKIRCFPMEKVKAEIDWMSEHKITYCYCADSNFGIAARDLEIAKYVVERSKETGYPQIFKPTYAKNSDDRVFEIGKILNLNGVDKGVTISWQSMSPTVLKNIGRHNLSLDYYSKLTARYAEEGIPTYTELILGLPGETYESFCRGICALLEAGQHNSMNVYTCQVYCNAPMAQPAMRDAFGIRWERVPMHGAHYPVNFNGILEYQDIVVETKDMPKSDWVRANLFSSALQSFHHLGLLRCVSLYARHELGISYYDFYNRLLDYIFSDENLYICSLFRMIEKKVSDTEHSDGCYQNDLFSKVGWYYEEGIFLDLVYHFDLFKEEIEGFVNSLGIPEEIRRELFAYQFSIIRLPGQDTVIIKNAYDFYTYFENIYEGCYSPLEKKETVLTIVTEKKIDRWDVYAKEIIWYGKRRSATLLTNQSEKLTCSYSQ